MFGPPSISNFKCGGRRGESSSSSIKPSSAPTAATTQPSASALLKKRLQEIEAKPQPVPKPDEQAKEEEEPELDQGDVSPLLDLEEFQYKSVFAVEEGEDKRQEEQVWGGEVKSRFVALGQSKQDKARARRNRGLRM